MSGYSRRTLLSMAGTATAVSIAGCSGADDGEEGENSNEEDGEPGADGADAAEPVEGSETGTDGTILGEITLENLHDERHSIDVVVEFDGEIEHWTTHDLDADSGAALERDWPSDPGSFRVTIRLDQGDPEQVTAAKWNDPDCLNLFALVARDGDLEIWSDTSGGPCESGADARSGTGVDD